tara:strand:+ start:165 stop:290 length:126 start_codon:yes stop_codon:yes gene_type:complete
MEKGQIKMYTIVKAAIGAGKRFVISLAGGGNTKKGLAGLFI